MIVSIPFSLFMLSAVVFSLSQDSRTALKIPKKLRKLRNFMATSNCKKFRLLLWKNYILQKRHPIQTVVQILLPILFVLLLLWIRLSAEPTHHNKIVYQAFRPTNITGFLSLLATNKNNSFSYEFPSESLNFNLIFSNHY